MNKREESEISGAFINSLKRNNREIRDDRATAIAEDTELVYKRKIEDLEISIKKMQREQEFMLDLSPASTQSLILASDFNCEEYVAQDIVLGVFGVVGAILIVIFTRLQSFIYNRLGLDYYKFLYYLKKSLTA